jgi:hypothetical protein
MDLKPMGAPLSVCNVYGVLDAGPEFRLTRYLLRFLRDDEVFYDVGAHIGFYTLLASSILRRGRVYGFEPNPYVYRALKANIIGISNAAAYPYALSDRVGLLSSRSLLLSMHQQDSQCYHLFGQSMKRCSK